MGIFLLSLQEVNSVKEKTIQEEEEVEEVNPTPVSNLYNEIVAVDQKKKYWHSQLFRTLPLTCVTVSLIKLNKWISAAWSGKFLTSLMNPEVRNPLGSRQHRTSSVSGHIISLSILMKIEPEHCRSLPGPERYSKMREHCGSPLLHIRYIHQQCGYSVTCNIQHIVNHILIIVNYHLFQDWQMHFSLLF